MKLAEALIYRASAQKRIEQLQERLKNVALVAEGQQPAEEPSELLADLGRHYAALEKLIKQINRTNAATQLEEGGTLTDLLATRDVAKKHCQFLHEFTNAAVPKKERLGRNELRYVASIDVPSSRKRVDQAAAELRKLEFRVQALNWQIDLIE